VVKLHQKSGSEAVPVLVLDIRRRLTESGIRQKITIRPSLVISEVVALQVRKCLSIFIEVCHF